MRPTFYGLEIAKTGLFISQKGLDVTGHNIANVDTAGYTRQRLNLQSIDPYNAGFKMKPLTKGLIGGGVQIQMVQQIRDKFLDRQYRTEQSNYSHWATRTNGLSYLESLFDSMQGSGIYDTIMAMFNAFDDTTHSSSDEEQRTITRQAALTMISSMEGTYKTMVTQLNIQNEAVKGVADEINSILDSLALLNDAIYRFEDNNGMQQANDLRDKRNLLLDELSAYIDIEYNEDVEGKMHVSICGVEVVNHTDVNKLECNQVNNPVTGENDLWELSLFTGNMIANPIADPQHPNYDPTAPATIKEMLVLTHDVLSGGELKGHLELRDNDVNDNPGIPYFIEQLNKLARALVQEINAVHQQGYTHPSGTLGSVNNVDFFDVSGGINSITAGNLKLSKDILDSVWNIACSSTEIDLNSADTAKAGNQENSKLLSALIDSTKLINNSQGVSSFNGYILSMVAEYAGTANHSKTQTSTLGTKVLSIDNNRTSVSGVSLDEEMTSLIRYQHAYQGASRVITAMDEALEMLINRMGLVGRS